MDVGSDAQMSKSSKAKSHDGYSMRSDAQSSAGSPQLTASSVKSSPQIPGSVRSSPTISSGGSMAMSSSSGEKVLLGSPLLPKIEDEEKPEGGAKGGSIDRYKKAM